jgi:hypothetical protein
LKHARAAASQPDDGTLLLAFAADRRETMPRLAPFALLATLLAVPGAASADPVDPAPGKPAPAPAKPAPPKKPASDPEQPSKPKTPGACATVQGGVRAEAYGYTHVVSLRNTCDKPVECDVWTDVDPAPRHRLRAAPGETVEVVTRLGSPASQVSAQKECKFR